MPFLAQNKRTFDGGGTDCYQENLSMIRTEADCQVKLLGRFTIYSINGVLKAVINSDLSIAKQVFLI